MEESVYLSVCVGLIIETIGYMGLKSTFKEQLLLALQNSDTVDCLKYLILISV